MKKIYFLFLSAMLFASYPANAQWTSLNPPKSSYETYANLAVSDNGKNLSSYSSDMKGIASYTTSHDYGATWQVNPTVRNIGGQVMFWEDDVLYIHDLAMKNLKKSTDFGATFTIQNETLSAQTPIVRAKSGKWYMEASSQYYYSTDKGVSWVASNNIGGMFITYVFANNGNVVTTHNGGIAYSTDDCESWTNATLPSNLKLPYSCISKSTDGTLLAFYYSSPSIVCRSTDNGVTWQQINSTIPANTKSMLYSGNEVIAYTILGSTYKSTDDGLTFSLLMPASLMMSVTSMMVANSNVYIYGMSDIYRYGDLTSGIDKTFSDNQLKTYPNPCRNEVKLSGAEFESYLITDLSGKVVRRNSISDNKIDLSTVDKGVYLLTVKETNGHSRVARIVKE
ncbi:MAG: T9SS type A sorting domain-containing protein [Bacteroidales bacterium]|nr:T9SS type A sorting domain-containing protein [Bacteroidales bacterium]